jgi:hypothetical protein
MADSTQGPFGSTVWPKNYGERIDDINVYPPAIYAGARAVSYQIEYIIGQWISIADIWKDLKISWTGESADAAQDLNDRLQKMQVELFGKEGTDGGSDIPGILTEVRGAADIAAQNYDKCEESVNRSWRMFHDQLLADNPGGEEKPDDKLPISRSWMDLGEPPK